jgi:hypothetical protein
MSESTNKRLVALVFVGLLFISYCFSRDTVQVYAKLSPKEVKTVVRGAVEWSAPKLFRTIEVRPAPNGCVAAWIRESGDRWSVTLFTNDLGGWKKTGWYLVEQDKSVLSN